MRRTKIVATLGPASTSRERIQQLIRAGVNVVRLNFSHGTQQENAERLAVVRDVARQEQCAVGVLADLQGPKIRTGSLVDGGPVELEDGATLTITTDEIVGDASRISTTYELLPADVRVHGTVLLADGMLELRVEKTTGSEVVCTVVHGGQLGEHKGINLPGMQISAPAVTRKDVDDLHFALEHDVDFVAISFVRYARDVQRVKDMIAQTGKETPVIAKIERPEAIEVLQDILNVADGVMVARGDLGVEIPAAHVPVLQKQIINAANQKGIPVITATQMLESMIQNPRPTRAEATDVANAILDGTDAVMLSGETAVGKYPVDTVKMMALIAETTEQSVQHTEGPVIRSILSPDLPLPPLAIGTAASAIVGNLPVKAVVVFTTSGDTARLVSQQRPMVPVLAFAHSEEVYRQMSLLWGIRPMLCGFTESLEAFEHQVSSTLLKHEHAQIGDLVVMTGGHPIARRGATNFLKIVEIGRPVEPTTP
jgi:pyruvate kinase